MELQNFDKILERVPKMSRPMRVILAGSDGAQDHQFSTSQRILIFRPLGRLQDNLANQPYGIHIDTGLR